jgi:hypothetical protein
MRKHTTKKGRKHTKFNLKGKNTQKNTQIHAQVSYVQEL